MSESNASQPIGIFDSGMGGLTVMRALMDCPVHAIMQMDERRPDDMPPPSSGDEDPAAHLKIESNEAEWGFTR